MIPGYGPASFYYAPHMTGSAGFPGSGGSAVMYGNPAAPGMYPLHMAAAAQSGQWDQASYMQAMMAMQQPNNRAQAEELQRMAAAQMAAANSRAGSTVRATAASPDLRGSSSSTNHLTGGLNLVSHAKNLIEFLCYAEYILFELDFSLFLMSFTFEYGSF